ncbi:hypothetical protein [Blastomonas aquatica]|nr:hypothetical protein [Blastomonas aquatica]
MAGVKDDPPVSKIPGDVDGCDACPGKGGVHHCFNALGVAGHYADWLRSTSAAITMQAVNASVALSLPDRA